MKRSQRWFNNNAQQDMTSRLSTLPVLSRTGPDNPSEPRNDNHSQEGQARFKVGKSKVGGGEVAG